MTAVILNYNQMLIWLLGQRHRDLVIHKGLVNSFIMSLQVLFKLSFQKHQFIMSIPQCSELKISVKMALKPYPSHL